MPALCSWLLHCCGGPRGLLGLSCRNHNALLGQCRSRQLLSLRCRLCWYADQPWRKRRRLCALRARFLRGHGRPRGLLALPSWDNDSDSRRCVCTRVLDLRCRILRRANEPGKQCRRLCAVCGRHVLWRGLCAVHRLLRQRLQLRWRRLHLVRCRLYIYFDFGGLCAGNVAQLHGLLPVRLRD